jgi:hypothetical protein
VECRSPATVGRWPRVARRESRYAVRFPHMCLCMALMLVALSAGLVGQDAFVPRHVPGGWLLPVRRLCARRSLHHRRDQGGISAGEQT